MLLKRLELGRTDLAAGYMNLVRARAGLTTPLLPTDMSFDRIVHERRVELAFEGHVSYDMKRWRLANQIWDGAPTGLADLKANIGTANKRSTQPWGLWPYRYYDLGGPNDGKWVFKETLPGPVTGANLFLMGNYYSRIGDDVIAANPKIIRAYDSYGLSELFGPGVAFECEGRNGLQIWHDCYLAAIIVPATGESLGADAIASRIPPSGLTPSISNNVITKYINNTLVASASPQVSVAGAGLGTGAKGAPLEVTVTAANTWFVLGFFVPGLPTILTATTVMQCE